MDNAQSTFEALVQAYSADLYRLAHWLTKDASLSEDMVQEVFMRAWKSLDSLQDPNSAKYWLFTILRREIARHYGKEKKDLVNYESDDELEQWLLVDHTSSEIEHWMLRRAMSQLAPDYLEPLLLQVLGGYSCDEIAGMTNSSAGAVTTRICRARQKLRQLLEGETPNTSAKVKK